MTCWATGQLPCVSNVRKPNTLQQHTSCYDNDVILCSLHRSRRAIEEATQRLSRAMDRADAHLDSRRGSRYSENGHYEDNRRGSRYAADGDGVHQIGRTAEHDFDRYTVAFTPALCMLLCDLSCSQWQCYAWQADNEVNQTGRTAEHDFNRWPAAFTLVLHMLLWRSISRSRQQHVVRTVLQCCGYVMLLRLIGT